MFLEDAFGRHPYPFQACQKAKKAVPGLWLLQDCGDCGDDVHGFGCLYFLLYNWCENPIQAVYHNAMNGLFSGKPFLQERPSPQPSPSPFPLASHTALH